VLLAEFRSAARSATEQGTAAPSLLVVDVNHWLGMSQSAAPQSTVTDSYLAAASHAAGAVAEQAADRKCLKYAELSSAYEFQPVAVEAHGY